MIHSSKFHLTIVLLSLPLMAAAQDVTTTPLVDFHCKEGNCSLKLPGQPTERFSKTAKGSTRSYRIIDNRCSFMFAVVEIEELASLNKEQINRRLDSMKNLLDPAHSKVTQHDKIALGGYPGREIRQESTSLEKTDGMQVARGRIFIVKNKLYMLSVCGEKKYVDTERCTTVLQSLKLLD